MRREPAPDEEADVDDDCGFETQDVDDRGAVEDSHVHGLTYLRLELLQVRQRKLRELEALQSGSPEDPHLEAGTILAAAGAAVNLLEEPARCQGRDAPVRRRARYLHVPCGPGGARA